MSLCAECSNKFKNKNIKFKVYDLCPKCRQKIDDAQHLLKRRIKLIEMGEFEKPVMRFLKPLEFEQI